MESWPLPYARRKLIERNVRILKPSKIAEILPDSRPWRVNWFGEVKYTQAAGKYCQPCIRMSVSPASGLDNSEDCSCFRDQISEQYTWLPVIGLGILRTGDVWQDGWLVTSSRFSKINLRRVLIGPSTAKPITVGKFFDEVKLSLPSEYSAYCPPRESYLIAIKISKNLTLTIPGPVAIGAHFESQYITLSRLFTAPFRTDNFYLAKHIDGLSRTFYIKLADGIPAYEAYTISQIANDFFVRRMAESIYSNCVKATSCGKLAYPYPSFPVRRKIWLLAEGTWISSDSNWGKVFFALKANTNMPCRGFRKLVYG